MSRFTIYINGEFFDEQSAKISVFDRGFLYGDSVYEATRTFNRHPFRLPLHLKRLFDSASKINLIPSLSSEEIGQAVSETIQKSPHENVALRIILTRGTNRDLGLDAKLAGANNLIIIAKPIDKNPDWWLTQGWSVIFYHKKNSPKGSLAKTSNYQDNTQALNSALEKGCQDALMINSEGFLTEGTTSNLWMIKNGKLLTPELGLGLLDGITRQTLKEVCRLQGIECLETLITPEELQSADEVFITSTTRNLVPVTKVEGQNIGSGRPGPMTLKLLSLYLAHVSQE